MVSLNRSRAVLELGKRLVNELDVGDDFLASWMAHHIAHQIDAAEKASMEAKAIAEEACAKDILELWKYRNTLPDRVRPLKTLEPVLRTLTSLDLDRTPYRYFGAVLQQAQAAETDESTQRWLNFAIQVDREARLLIRSALRAAAADAASKTETWVTLANEAGADEVAEAVLIRFALSPDEAKEKRTSALQDRLSQLEAFMELTELLIKEVKTELESSEIDTSEKPE